MSVRIRFHRWLAAGSLILIVAALPLQRLRGSFPTERFFHSDIAFLPALFGDLAGGGSLSSWGLPEAPYFVPDWPLYLIAWSVAPSYSSGVAIYAFLQIGLLAVAWLGLMRYLSGDALVTTVLGVGLLVAAGLAGQVPADYASVSFARFGTFILTVAGLVLYFRYHFGQRDEPSGARSRLRLLAALFLLACVGSASDRLFIAWWAVPVVTMESLAYCGRRLGRVSPRLGRAVDAATPGGDSGRVAASVAAGTVAGLLIHAVVVRSSGNYAVEVRTDLSMRERMSLVVDIFARSELIELWPVYSVAVLVAGLAWGWMCWQLRNHKPTVVFALWFVLASATTIAAEAATAQAGWRFHQFMYHVPILMVGIWLLPFLRRLVVPASVLTAAGSLTLFAWGATPIDELSLTHTPAEVTCLDDLLSQSGSRVGIGNYAASRIAVVHSAFELDVGTRNTWMAPEEDVHSRAWARTSADFAILYPTIFGTIPETTIRSLSADEPVERQCGQWHILDFGPNGLDLDRLTAPGASAHAPGCWYTNSIGEPDPVPRPPPTADHGCVLRVTPDDITQNAGNYIGFGSYYDVTPGSYRLSAQLSPGHTADGFFEVAVWESNSGTLQTIYRTSLADPSIPIDVGGNGPELSLEPRILYQGGSPLVLEQFTVERTN